MPFFTLIPDEIIVEILFKIAADSVHNLILDDESEFEERHTNEDTFYYKKDIDKIALLSADIKSLRATCSRFRRLIKEIANGYGYLFNEKGRWDFMFPKTFNGSAAVQIYKPNIYYTYELSREEAAGLPSRDVMCNFAAGTFDYKSGRLFKEGVYIIDMHLLFTAAGVGNIILHKDWHDRSSLLDRFIIFIVMNYFSIDRDLSFDIFYDFDLKFYEFLPATLESIDEDFITITQWFGTDEIDDEAGFSISYDGENDHIDFFDPMGEIEDGTVCSPYREMHKFMSDDMKILFFRFIERYISQIEPYKNYEKIKKILNFIYAGLPAADVKSK